MEEGELGGGDFWLYREALDGYHPFDNLGAIYALLIMYSSGKKRSLELVHLEGASV